MKYYSYVILTIMMLHFTSCNSQITPDRLSGTYESSKLNKLEQLKYKTNKNINGLTLILKKDSTYHYDTCGILIDGDWSIKDDSLIMNVKSIKFRNDSINKTRKPETRKDFLVYKIEKNTLLGFVDGINGYRINKLTKVRE